MTPRSQRRAAVALLALATLATAPSADAARLRHRHRHHRTFEPVPSERFEPPPPSLRERAAAQSGFAFGLLDLGISGTPTAISPYAGVGYGTIGPGYAGPGYGYPGY